MPTIKSNFICLPARFLGGYWEIIGVLLVNFINYNFINNHRTVNATYYWSMQNLYVSEKDMNSV